MNGRDAPAALPWERIPVFIECETWWAPEMVWVVLEGKKSLTPPGIETADCPARSLSLYRLTIVPADRVNMHVRFLNEFSFGLCRSFITLGPELNFITFV
jgi:hypothetical protein